MAPLERDAQAVFAAAVAGAQPAALMAGLDLRALLRRPLGSYGRVAVVGAGKAALAMAAALEPGLEGVPVVGAVTVPRGYPEALPPGLLPPVRVAARTGGHPVPDGDGAAAAAEALAVAEGLGRDDVLVVLLSGGGSALWPAPPEGVPLADLQEAVRVLLRSGADIHAVNAVRKHLSRIGGGGLARAAAPAETLALALSDVVGDDLSTLASGPTVPDPTTFAEALGVLERGGEGAPASVRAYLEQGRRGEVPETPKPGDLLFERVTTRLVGSNRDALDAAEREARRLGYRVVRHAEPVTGEAREGGGRLAREALEAPPGSPVCLLWGGETTVTVTGEGRGGRNQELALAAALALEGAERSVVLLSGGTDGVDGPTDAAGAWVTPGTAAEARARGLPPEDHLARNDAYPLLDALGLLLKPGPTHTNVMDVQVVLAR